MKTKTRYVRNIHEIIVTDTIDPDSLWRLDGKLLILVDDDQYIDVNYEDRKKEFREVYDQE